jgi:quinol monooxygenase YgiN
MRIVWGKILPGQWDAFEAAFKKALEIRGQVKGLKSQWLLRDQNDPDAGYSISQWESDEDMHAFWNSKKRSDAMTVIQPFFVNQFTVTDWSRAITSGRCMKASGQRMSFQWTPSTRQVTRCCQKP